MRAVIQRVRSGSVEVDGKIISSIQNGLIILLGIGPGDTEEVAAAMTRKISLLRIFEDEAGKINLSVKDTGGQVIVVSQFTLYADTRKGNRPSFIDAAPPEMARALVERFASLLNEQGVSTQTGEFGAHMLVSLENDGPVTIILEG
ncbi:MAG: D-aminoacyl-tRNA deacylase [Anaerolineaceae bacterium]